MAITLLKVIQGHQFWDQSKARKTITSVLKSTFDSL